MSDEMQSERERILGIIQGLSLDEAAEIWQNYPFYKKTPERIALVEERKKTSVSYKTGLKKMAEARQRAILHAEERARSEAARLKGLEDTTNG